jgi:hypothetical protein
VRLAQLLVVDRHSRVVNRGPLAVVDHVLKMRRAAALLFFHLLLLSKDFPASWT